MQELTRLALLGCANAGQDVSTSVDTPALQAASSREQRLLWQAGSLAVYLAAGQRPQTGSLPQGAPLDAQAEVPAALHPLLNAAIGGELGGIAPWLVQRLRACGLRLPAQLLPQVLDKQAALETWHTVIGVRGHWLAGHNPSWQRRLDGQLPAQLDEATLQRNWEEGNIDQRRHALATLRKRDPALAREWLLVRLPKERGEPKVALVQALKPGLSLADEPLLESLLDDRNLPVRLAAARLLTLLPESTFRGRMLARAQACLHWQVAAPAQGVLAKLGNLLNKPAPASLRVDLPEDLPKDWERDGLREQSATGLGKRAALLCQLLEHVPPSHWSDLTGLTPAQLLPILAADEWNKALLTGVLDASYRYQDAEWGAALMDAYLADNPLLRGDEGKLWACLNDVQREALICQHLRQGSPMPASYGLRGMRTPWPSTLSAAISQAVLADARQPMPSDAQRPGFDFSQLSEQLLLHCADDDLPKLGELVALYADRLAQGPLAGQRQYERARLIVALAEAKQTAIKEMPL